MLRFAVPAIGAATLFLASCAPRPTPIVPEPVYDKFGHLEDVCVSDEQLRDPNTTAQQRQLPRCEDHCDPNEQPTFTAVGQWPICVPRPEDDDTPDNPRNPNDQTGG